MSVLLWLGACLVVCIIVWRAYSRWKIKPSVEEGVSDKLDNDFLRAKKPLRGMWTIYD